MADRNDHRVLQEETIIGFLSVQGTLSDIQDEQINKILCMCTPGTIEIVEREVKAAFPDCSVVKSSDRLLEIMAQGVNKAARWSSSAVIMV